MENVVITQRDLDVLEFLLDMKFATITEIHQKFFRKLRNGNTSHSEWYARERMRLLWKHGHVESVRFRYTDRKYFIATEQAYWFLYNSRSGSVRVGQPIRQIDIRTFEHDALLIKLRLHLEEKESISNWK